MNAINSSPITFNGTLYWNKSIGETSSYAREIGQTEIYRHVKRIIKKLPERNIRIIHKYCKRDGLSKTQFQFKKYGFDYLFISTDRKIKNPAELTLQLLKDLLNPQSKIYKEIYG